MARIHSFFNMTRGAVLICVLVLNSLAFAKPVSVEKAQKAADKFLKTHRVQQEKGVKRLTMRAAQRASHVESAIASVKKIYGDDGKILAYVTELEPEGFIITSADDNIRPVLGYSFKGKFPFEDSKQNVLLHLVQWDMEARLKTLNSGAPEITALAQSNTDSWDMYTLDDDESLQATASSSTQWGPLIVTQWDQGGHFNDRCPLLTTGGTTRCAVGCVATSIAQIVNYWAYPSSVSFSVADDSYISRGNAGDIDIDGDSTQRDFPDFGELNAALSTINYSGNNAEEAYLCFAAGIKAHMDYGSQSGTILSSGVYRDGFDYGSAQVKYQSGNLWSSYEDKVIENIKDGWPVQIGIQESGRTGGHSVIVDGYKTTGDLHFWINYGWGGTNDMWYNPPDIQNYDLVTQIVFNICPYQGWNQWGADEKNSFSTIYVAPTTDPPVNKWYRTCSSGYSFKGLVVGTGNKIYASCIPDTQGNNPSVWVINQYGEKETEITINEEIDGLTYPVQNSDGEVFVGADSGKIYKINPKNDSYVEIFDAGEQLYKPPKVDSEGRIYVCTLYKLYCLSRTGYKYWEFATPNTNYSFFRKVPAIDVERNRVYIDYYNSATDVAYLVCINRTSGAEICQKSFTGITSGFNSVSTPSIGQDGTVYAGCYTSLYAFNPDATLSQKWAKDLFPTYVTTSPTVGPTDTIYTSHWVDLGGDNYNLRIGSRDASNGNLNWWYSQGTSNICDSIGDIYVSGNNVVSFWYNSDDCSLPSTHTIYALRDNGASYDYLWKKDFGQQGGQTAFGPGATLYTISSTLAGNTIYALSEGDVGDPDGGGMGFTDNAAPLMPSTPTPADEANDLGANVTLSWTCSDPEAHTLKYSLFVGESGYDMVPVATDITDTSYELTELKSGTGYAWKIISTDGQAVSESPTWVFATEPPSPDINGDGIVDFGDFSVLAGYWQQGCDGSNNYCEGADLCVSDFIDVNDLLILCQNWLAVNEPQVPESVVAYWSCNEGSGITLTDDSGNGHDGSINGATWVDGVSGKALSFDGNGNYVSVPSSNDLSFTSPSEAFSASFWINPDSVIPSDQTILENEDDYLISLYGGVLSYRKTDSGNLYHNCWQSTNPEISAGNWSHVVITYDGSGAGGTKMYVNGEEKPVTNTAYHGGGSASGDDFAIGIRAFDFASEPYGGEIDEVRIYNRVLNPAEIGVVAYWSCNEGSGITLTDDSGNGHDGSINGATWVDGVSGKALSFDGNGNYVSVPSSNDLSFTSPSEAFSTSFWINPDSVIPSDQTILENEDDYLISLYGGVLSYRKTDSGNLYHNCWQSTNPEISAGNWTHVVITYDGTGAGGTKMYVNGEEKPVTNTAYHGGGSASGDDFAIGIRAFDFASAPYGGEIDEVRIYDRALTSTEVQYLYENQ